jgi:hypothetical protein
MITMALMNARPVSLTGHDKLRLTRPNVSAVSPSLVKVYVAIRAIIASSSSPGFV